MEILHYQESFFTIKQVKLVEKKEFVVVAFNLGYKTFIIYIIFLDSSNNNQIGNNHLFCKAQIVLFILNKTFTIIFTKYSNIADILFSELVLNFLNILKSINMISC